MYNVYLYGASDDCMEVETDYSGGGESYVGMMIGSVRAHYVFDGDWGIWLEGEIPASWIVHPIPANHCQAVRGKPYAGQFIHIQVPDMVVITELSDKE
jgi:hypothetical protein